MPHTPPPSLNEYLAFACRLASLAGEAILPYFRVAIDVHNKAADGGFDPVTAADRAAEDVIRREIHRAHPGHGIRGEEHGHVQSETGWTWVVDPIDGTRGFILGQLHWATLIALNDGSQPVLGVVHQPYVGETFVGSPSGAELRHAGGTHRLRTRACPRLEDAVVCTTHPEVFQTRAERAIFALIAAKARQVRYGGDCYNYSLLAAGLVDLVIESSLFAYDVQAVIPIVKAAGGVMTTWKGAAADEGGQVIAAGDPNLHAEVLRLLAWAAL